MEDLNTDCLLNIFHCLNFSTRIQMELVCHRWHQLLRKHCAYSNITKLDASELQRATTLKQHQQKKENFELIMLNVVSRCGPYLKRIEFGAIWTLISQPIIDNIAKYCIHLNHLDLSCVIIGADILQLLDTIGHQLVFLSLEEASWTDERNQLKITSSLRRMKRLVKLNLRRFTFSTDELVDVGPIECLDISGARNLTANAFRDFVESHSANIRELDMCPMPVIKTTMHGTSELDSTIESHVMTDYTTANKEQRVETIGKNNENNQWQIALNAIGKLKEIQILSLGYIKESPATLSLINLSLLRNLRLLHLQECDCLDSSTLRAIISNIPNLKTLHLIGCLKVDNYSCIAYLNSLRELEIRKTSEFCDSDLERIASNGSLKRLRLEFCSNITNRVFHCLLSKCPQLCELEISKCENIDDEVFVNTDEWSQLTQLQILSFNGLNSITNKSIMQLANTTLLRTLRELDISHNKNIDDTPINAIHKSLTNELIASKRKAKTLIMYVYQTGITKSAQENVMPEIELIF